MSWKGYLYPLIPPPQIIRSSLCSKCIHSNIYYLIRLWQLNSLNTFLYFWSIFLPWTLVSTMNISVCSSTFFHGLSDNQPDFSQSHLETFFCLSSPRMPGFIYSPMALSWPLFICFTTICKIDILDSTSLALPFPLRSKLKQVVQTTFGQFYLEVSLPFQMIGFKLNLSLSTHLTNCSNLLPLPPFQTKTFSSLYVPCQNQKHVSGF